MVFGDSSCADLLSSLLNHLASELRLAGRLHLVDEVNGTELPEINAWVVFISGGWRFQALTRSAPGHHLEAYCSGAGTKGESTGRKERPCLCLLSLLMESSFLAGTGCTRRHPTLEGHFGVSRLRVQVLPERPGASY